MPPNADGIPKSTLGISPPPRRHGLKQTIDMWLEDKVATDNAEGLWRIGDNLYDLTDFVEHHPGGSQWLELSKGLDITTAFEVHHISETPEKLVQKYFVRKAKHKRNSPFTFKDDGFYRTLKREVREQLKTIPDQPARTTNFLIDAILVILFFLSILAAKYWNFFLGLLAGNFLAFLTIAAHNYLHRRDNFRMYYFNFSLMQVREWRVSHVLSHHMHTNTIDDLEISGWEPFLQYMPIDKKPAQRYGQWCIAPIMWFTGFFRALIGRLLEYFIHGRTSQLQKTDLVPFSLPLAMYLFSGQSLLNAILMWCFIVVVGSTHFFFVGLHAAHHHPDIFHDGDEPRREEYDWGVGQLDAVMDRKEITGSHFLVLTNFGDHALHHMFPTLDHGKLDHLYPVLRKVLTQFNANLRIVSQLDTIAGGFQQLKKVEPSKAPPDLNKYKFVDRPVDYKKA